MRTWRLRFPPALGSLIWPTLDTLSAFVVGFAVVLMIARLIGDAAFGLGSIALSIILVVLVAVNSVVHDAMIWRETLSEEDADSALSASIAFALLATVVVGVSAPLISSFLGYRDLERVLWGFLPLFVLNGLATPLIAERRRALQFGMVGRHQILGRLIGAIAAFVLARLGAGVWAYVALHGVAALYVATAMLVLTPRKLAWRLSWSRVAPMVGFCRPIIISQFLSHALARLLVVAMGYWHGLSAAGHWSVAVRLSDSVVGGATQAVYNVALAYMSKVQASRETLLNSLRKAQGLAMMAATPALAALAAGAHPLIAMLLGDGWEPAAPMLLCALIGSFLYLRRMLPNAALRAIGRSDVSSAASAADLAVGGAALLAFGAVSPVFIAVISAAAAIPGYLFNARAISREFPEPLARELASCAQSLAVGLIAAAFGFLAGQLMQSQSTLDQLLVRSSVAFTIGFAIMAVASRRLLQSFFAPSVQPAVGS